MEPQRFIYYLKLRDGRLLYAEGESWEGAARGIGIRADAIKRSMPVKRVLTEAEKAERAETFRKLREIYGKTNS